MKTKSPSVSSGNPVQSSLPNFSRDIYGFPQPRSENKHRISRIPKEITLHDVHSTSVPEMLPSQLQASHAPVSAHVRTRVELERDLAGLQSVIRDQVTRQQAVYNQERASDALIADVVFYDNVVDEQQCQQTDFRESATTIKFVEKHVPNLHPIDNDKNVILTGHLAHQNLDPQVLADNMFKMKRTEVPSTLHGAKATATYHPKSSQAKLDGAILDVLRYSVVSRADVQPQQQPKMVQQTAQQRHDYAKLSKSRQQRKLRSQHGQPDHLNQLLEPTTPQKQASRNIHNTSTNRISSSPFKKENSSQHQIKRSLLEQERVKTLKKEQNIGSKGSNGVIINKLNGLSEVSFDAVDAKRIQENQAQRFRQHVTRRSNSTNSNMNNTNNSTLLPSLDLPEDHTEMTQSSMFTAQESELLKTQDAIKKKSKLSRHASKRHLPPRNLQTLPPATVDVPLDIPEVVHDSKPKQSLIDSRIHNHLQLSSGVVSQSRRALMPSNLADIHDQLHTNQRDLRKHSKKKSLFARQQHVNKLNYLQQIEEEGATEHHTMLQNAQFILDNVNRNTEYDAFQVLRTLSTGRTFSFKNTPLHQTTNQLQNRDQVGSQKVTEDEKTKASRVVELRPTKMLEVVVGDTVMDIELNRSRDKFNVEEFKQRYYSVKPYEVTDDQPYVSVVQKANTKADLYPSNTLDTLLRTAKMQSLASWNAYQHETNTEDMLKQHTLEKLANRPKNPQHVRIGMSESEYEWLREEVKEKKQYEAEKKKQEQLEKTVQKRISIIATTGETGSVVVQRCGKEEAEEQRLQQLRTVEQKHNMKQGKQPQIDNTVLRQSTHNGAFRMANPTRLLKMLNQRKSQSEVQFRILQNITTGKNRVKEQNCYLRQCQTSPLVQSQQGVVLPRSLLQLGKKPVAEPNDSATSIFTEWISKKSDYIVQRHTHQAKILQTMSMEACKTMTQVLLREKASIATQTAIGRTKENADADKLRLDIDKDLLKDMSALRGEHLFRHAVKQIIFRLRTEAATEKTERKAMRRIVMRKKEVPAPTTVYSSASTETLL